MKKNNQKGFTLIELLVVIAIIGLLSTMAVVALNNARQKSRDAKRVADVKQIQTALEMYFNSCNQYPELAVAGALTTTMAQGCTTETLGTYLGQIPKEPTPDDNTCTAANNKYMYQAPVGGATYTLTFCLGAATGQLAAGVRTASPVGVQ